MRRVVGRRVTVRSHLPGFSRGISRGRPGASGSPHRLVLLAVLAALAALSLSFTIGLAPALAMPPNPGLLRGILNGSVAYEGLPEGTGPPEAAQEAARAEAVAAGEAEARDGEAAVAEGDGAAGGGGGDGGEPDPAAAGDGGSLSVGYTAWGSLENAAAVPASGDGFALLPFVPERGTYYATDEMVGLLARVGARVLSQYPDAVVRIGNISAREGGKIRWSVSHRAGRDADLAFFAEDGEGRPLPVRDYETFGRSGASRDGGGRRFAVARNWAVVEALVMDPEVRVQRIFVADWLREKLLRHARESGAEPQAILRAELVLAQPRDSAPHADHFHVRIYCSLDDKLSGCHDFGPVWPWVDTYDAEVAERIASLVRSLATAPPGEKVEALHLLRRLEAHDRAEAVGRALSDPDERVGRAALRCLRTLRSDSVPKSIAAAIRKTMSPAWALELLAALEAERADGHAPLLERIVQDTAKALPRLVGSEAELARVRAAAARTLGRSGRQASAKHLIAALLDDYGAVRQAAADALPYLTNHDFGGRWKKGTSKKRLARQQKRWLRWYRKNIEDSHAQWVRQGFERKGIRFRGKMVSRRSIPILIRALSRGSFYAHNAKRILVRLVGPTPAIRCGTKSSCWRKWWRRHHDEYGHRTARL